MLKNTDMVLSIVIAPALAFNRVLDALVAQAVGSGNRAVAGVWLQQSMFFLSAAMLCSVPLVFLVKDILALLGFREGLCRLAGTYAKWNLFWFIPNGIYQCLRFYFQALGFPRPAMYNNVLFVFVNALLNWVFVFGGPFQYSAAFGYWKGFGFIGAAISLSFSRVLQPMTYVYYMFFVKGYHVGAWPGWDMSMHTRARVKEFLVQSLPRVGTNIFQSVIGQSTTILISQLGPEAIAASTAVSTITRIYVGSLCAVSLHDGASCLANYSVDYYLFLDNRICNVHTSRFSSRFVDVSTRNSSSDFITSFLLLGRGDYVAAARSGYLVMKWCFIVMLLPTLALYFVSWFACRKAP